MDTLDISIPASALQEVLRGVSVASQAPQEIEESLLDWILLDYGEHLEDDIPVNEWLTRFSAEHDQHNEDSVRLFLVTLAVSILRQTSRAGKELSALQLNGIWDLLRRAIAISKPTYLRFKVTRSAPGYLAIPLYSVLAGGKISELLRIHVWLPDGVPPRVDVGIHAHQTFTQSWVLAGQMTNHKFSAKPTEEVEEATNAEFVPRWDDGKYAGASYKTDQLSSTARNTGKLLVVTSEGSDKQTSNTSYSMKPGEYHMPSAADRQFCATIFYFDASRGFVQNAPVIGPKNGAENIQKRDPGAVTSSGLVILVDAVRKRDTTTSKAPRDQGEDEMVNAYYRLFCGKDLFAASDHEDAFHLLNGGSCPPIVALCKEPSDAHRRYLQELIDIGVDIDVTDDRGYKALDYAVLNNDPSAEAILVDGYRKVFDDDVASDVIIRMKNEADIRKTYHHLFEARLRPILQKRGEGFMKEMRFVYADALAQDPEWRSKFDGLRYLWYSDFASSPRLPRYMDGRVRTFSADEDAEDNAEYIIYLSYRWIHKDPVTGKTAPDDKDHTQFQRMLRALELFLQCHPAINVAKLGIWIDSVCIDRRAPNPGISALPINIAQCDALITISDEVFWKRAWCSAEALMFQRLRQAYSGYEWYEYAPQGGSTADSSDTWDLREAPENVEIDMSTKSMTWEQDRTKIEFLERQARLLSGA